MMKIKDYPDSANRGVANLMSVRNMTSIKVILGVILMLLLLTPTAVQKLLMRRTHIIIEVNGKEEERSGPVELTSALTVMTTHGYTVQPPCRNRQRRRTCNICGSYDHPMASCSRTRYNHDGAAPARPLAPAAAPSADVQYLIQQLQQVLQNFGQPQPQANMLAQPQPQLGDSVPVPQPPVAAYGVPFQLNEDNRQTFTPEESEDDDGH
jgi:hypothetical protein